MSNMKDMMQTMFLCIITYTYFSESLSIGPCTPIIVGEDSSPDEVFYAACSAYIELYPSTVPTNELIELFYNKDDTAVSYSINFVPRGGDCINPAISFSYIDIDNNADDEFLTILYDENALIDCSGDDPVELNKCELVNCITDQPLPTTTIPVDTPHTIMIMIGPNIDSTGGDCDSIESPLVDINATLVANLTITCDAVPTTTAAATTTVAACDCDCDGSDDSGSSSDEAAANANALNNNELNDKYLEDDTDHIIIKISKNTMFNLWLIFGVFSICSGISIWCCFKKNEKNAHFVDSNV